jgi:hypothetical protein
VKEEKVRIKVPGVNARCGPSPGPGLHAFATRPRPSARSRFARSIFSLNSSVNSSSSSRISSNQSRKACYSAGDKRFTCCSTCSSMDILEFESRTCGHATLLPSEASQAECFHWMFCTAARIFGESQRPFTACDAQSRPASIILDSGIREGIRRSVCSRTRSIHFTAAASFSVSSVVSRGRCLCFDV